MGEVRVQTIVRTIRVSEDLWESLDVKAKAKGKSRNRLITEVLSRHCYKKSKKVVDKEKQVC